MGQERDLFSEWLENAEAEIQRISSEGTLRRRIPASEKDTDVLLRDGVTLMQSAVTTATTLSEEVNILLSIIREMLGNIRMHLQRGTHATWVCPVCKRESRNLTALERGEGHTDMCTYARASALLRGWER